MCLKSHAVHIITANSTSLHPVAVKHEMGYEFMNATVKGFGIRASVRIFL